MSDKPTKIDLTSSVLEKGIDLAKEFLDKLVLPGIQEVGLLAKDKVSLWRFQTQLKTVLKAKEYCHQLGISPKAISIKVLSPLIDFSGLEDEELLQDKWSALLVNMIDSEKNIQNHVFPYLLSQISKQEYLLIETARNKKIQRVEALNSKLVEFQAKMKSVVPGLESDLKAVILEQEKTKTNDKNSYDLFHRKKDLEKELRQFESDEWKIKSEINESEELNNFEFEEYEMYNLIRLGILRISHKYYGYSKEHKVDTHFSGEARIYDLEIEISEHSQQLLLTELGEMFIDACTLKLPTNPA